MDLSYSYIHMMHIVRNASLNYISERARQMEDTESQSPVYTDNEQDQI
jgi:hypothetical protein